jgi:vacuolar-type H+-ATPase subunit E/Vma4
MEKIAKKILEDAEREKKEIIETAEQKIEKIREETQKEINKLRNETQEKAEEMLEKEKRRIVGMRRLKMRNELLKFKRGIMDSLFDKALDLLYKKEEEEYLKVVKKLLLLTNAKEGEIIVDNKETRITHEFVKDVNNELGANFSLSSKRRDIRGGFILHQKNIEIDCSFVSLLEKRREKIELELGKFLFD